MNPDQSIPFTFEGAVFLAIPELWLDPHRASAFAFVSHAHADHFAAHQRILCARGTYELIKARFGSRSTDFTVLEFGESIEENGYRLTLIPAGHITGSAQLLVEDLDTGRSLIYTGDFKTRESLTAEPIEIRHADILIMETTFGLPRYLLPPNHETFNQIAAFVQAALSDGDIPVVQGYSLGKAQELIAGIAARLPEANFQVHPAVHKMNRVVAKLGFNLPECEVFDPEKRSPSGCVLVIPPSAGRSKAIRSIKNVRSCMATGWAVNAGAKFRYQVDEAFPLSDHAGYDELLAFVEAVNPDVVFTLHGSASAFASDLRNLGTDAWSLIGENQLELNLGIQPKTQFANVGELTPLDLSGELARLTELCQQIRDVPGKNDKRDLLAPFLSELSKDNLEMVCLYLTGRCFPACSADGRRRKTGIGWASIKRALMRAARVTETEYLDISVSQGDSARTAYLILEGKGEGRSASIAEVSALFESLSELQGPTAKESVLIEWFRYQHHAESALLVSILLGDLRIGLGEGLLEEAIAIAFDSPPSEVRKAQMYTGHLGLTAILAKEGRLDQWELTPFNPLSCMLASPSRDAEEIYQRLSENGQSQVWVEDKYDGIRAQLHYFEGCAEWFSRDLQPLTEEFPELVEAAQHLSHDLVLDGEIIAYAEGKKLSFFDLQTRLGRRRNEGDLFFGEAVPVTFVAFDLLWLDGRILTETALNVRRDLLDGLILPESFEVAKIHHVSSIEAIDKIFEDARVIRNNEGLIAKDPHSHYLPGARGRSWLKLKKAAATLDVVVIRAEHGHGRRAHVLSDYTFAVRDESNDTLKVIGKAHSGLTDEEIEMLTEHFRSTTTAIQQNVHTVEPDTVLEIAFDSIQPSSKHDSGLSLRFPRIKSIRNDKTITGIDTLEAARELAGGG